MMLSRRSRRAKTPTSPGRAARSFQHPSGHDPVWERVKWQLNRCGNSYPRSRWRDAAMAARCARPQQPEADAAYRRAHEIAADRREGQARLAVDPRCGLGGQVGVPFGTPLGSRSNSPRRLQFPSSLNVDFHARREWDMSHSTVFKGGVGSRTS